MANVVGNPGRYDHVAAHLVRELAAEAVLVLVIQGNKGNGVSVAGRGFSAIERRHEIADILRGVADMLEEGEPSGYRVDKL